MTAVASPIGIASASHRHRATRRPIKQPTGTGSRRAVARVGARRAALRPAAMRALLIAAAACSAAADFGRVTVQDSYQYCIVGGGPGGLQLGHYMQLAGRDYMLFERTANAGHFFTRFPIHRQLISLNKRHTGRDNTEFNLRHDWNSLLDAPSVLPVTNRSTQRFPDAGVLATYLQDFGDLQADHISYETTVERIDKMDESDRFRLAIRQPSGELSVDCTVVIMANGLWVPNTHSTMRGIELVTGYEELPKSGEIFEGKSVAILGMGNSAFEIANAAADYANYVHIWPTRASGIQNSIGSGSDKVWKWPQLSFESRYVGSTRAIRAGHLDGYLLKSLDSLPLGDVFVAEPNRMMVTRCNNGTQKCLWQLQMVDIKGDGNKVAICTVGSHKVDERDIANLRARIDRIRDLGIPLYETAQTGGSGTKAHLDVVSTLGGQTTEYAVPAKAQPDLSVFLFASDLERLTSEQIDAVVEYRRNRSGDSLARPYDYVIRAMGWKHNVSVYGENAQPVLQHQRKYPRMTPEYESINVPNMHFAGTLAHGKDWRRASGGFIHGFRYTARALHRQLEMKHHNQPWPEPTKFGSKFDLSDSGGVDALIAAIVKRICIASGPYQMFYTLADAIVISRDVVETTAKRSKRKGKAQQGNDSLFGTYMEEVPVDFLHSHEQWSKQHRFAVMFGFDGQHRYENRGITLQVRSFERNISDATTIRTLSESIKDGTGFEPWVWYWPPASSNKPKQIFRLIEHLATDWGSEDFSTALGAWIAPLIDRIAQPDSEDHAKPLWAGEPKERTTAGLAALHIDLTIVVSEELREVPVRLSRVVKQTGDGSQKIETRWEAATKNGYEIGSSMVKESCFAGDARPVRTLQPLPPNEPASDRYFRVTSFDSEAWEAVYRIPVTPVSGNAAASRLVRERFIVAFEAGIVQEIHIGEGLLLDGNGALPEAGPTPTVGWYSPAQIERALGPIERANATAVF